MNNYKLTVAYDGSRYQGWEHQPDTDLTVQGKLEAVFSALEGRPVEVTGAGRTDSGVHALGMVANVRLETDMTAAASGRRWILRHWILTLIPSRSVCLLRRV